MKENIKRRWFRFAFSLRTLFLVVTVFSIWLGLEVRHVQARKAMAQRIDAAGGSGTFRGKSIWYRLPPVAWHRQLLGDRNKPHIQVPENWTADEIANVRWLFPEAKIDQRSTKRALLQSDNETVPVEPASIGNGGDQF